LNQGNSANGKKSSRPSSSNQKPCCETLVTSAAKVVVPGMADLVLSGYDDLTDAGQVLSG
jgi:hypothetical protein